MEEKIFLGVDVGGTKTHAIICKSGGQVLGFGKGPGGNPENVGENGLRDAMRIAIDEAQAQINAKSLNFQAAGFGISGFDWDSDRLSIERVIHSLQLGCEFVLDNDVVPTIWAGTSQGWGIAVSAGTGNNVRGKNAAGKIGRISGNSIRNGEYGGASEMIFLAQQKISQIWTGRENTSILVGRLIEITGAKNIQDLVEGLVRGRYQLDAEFAPIILEVAQAGDPVALEIVWFNAHELVKSVQAVANQLDLTDTPFELVMSGSLLTKSSYYRDIFIEIIQHHLPKAKPILLEIPPVAGAAMMAMAFHELQYPNAPAIDQWHFSEIQTEMKRYFHPIEQ